VASSKISSPGHISFSPRAVPERVANGDFFRGLRDIFDLNVSCEPSTDTVLIEIDVNTSRPELQKKLRSNGWLFEEEQIKALEVPGEGNMNVVLRVVTNKRSFILKQSRPYVRKYPEIKAPEDRITVEYQFYRTIRNPQAQAHFPRILAYDPSHFLLQLEDLGDCEDLTCWYERRAVPPEQLSILIQILNRIHAEPPPTDFPGNLPLRELNHQHVFVLPFMVDNGFALDDIQPGLERMAAEYKKDRKLKGKAEKIGKRYLKPGKVLLHGDYFPGSWMAKGNKVFVIDPEFSFVGFPEYDLGVMAAHTILATSARAGLKTILREYQGKADADLVSQVAGIEIIRRLIGLAQLPLDRSLEEKEQLLKTAREMILL